MRKHLDSNTSMMDPLRELSKGNVPKDLPRAVVSISVRQR
jgi:hypothetical protein